MCSFVYFRNAFSHEDFDLSLAPKLVNRNKTAKKDAEQYLLDRREQTDETYPKDIVGLMRVDGCSGCGGLLKA